MSTLSSKIRVSELQYFPNYKVQQFSCRKQFVLSNLHNPTVELLGQNLWPTTDQNRLLHPDKFLEKLECERLKPEFQLPWLPRQLDQTLRIKTAAPTQNFLGTGQ